jgi:hypothetical protein
MKKQSLFRAVANRASIRFGIALILAAPLAVTPSENDIPALAVAPEQVAFSQAGVSAAPTQWVDRILVEDFNDAGDTQAQLRSTDGIVSAVGTIRGSSAGSFLFTEQQWGGAPCADCTGTRASKFPAVGNGTITFTLASSTTYRYVGFWWAAGSPNNNICLLPETGSTCVADYNTGDLMAHASFSTSGVSSPFWQNGRPHYGNPRGRVYTGTTQCNGVSDTSGVAGQTYSDHCREPFAFIHIFQDSGFRRVQFSGDANTGFEFDNVTVSTAESWELIDLLPANTLIGASTLPAYSLTAARVIPVDPRSGSVSFSGVVLGGAANAQPNASLCLTEVDSSGTPVAASTSQNLRLSATVPSTGVTRQEQLPRTAYSGSQTTIRDLSRTIRINSSSVNRSVVSSGSKYLRVSIQARTGTGLTTCAATSNVITAVLVELRPIRLNSVNQLGIPID